jgi:hypothetical protein
VSALPICAHSAQRIERCPEQGRYWHVSTTPIGTSEPAALRTLLLAVTTAVRAATAANLNLTRTSAGQAENTAVACRTHAGELAAALNGLDDALRALTPPTTSSSSLGG